MKICLECAEGGHLDEMMSLMDAFKGHDIFLVTVKAESTKDLAKRFRVYYPRNQYKVRGRSRAVQQMWILLVESLYLIKLLFACFWILLKERPKAIVTVGGGATIPLCYLGKLLRTKIIYIVSLARTQTLPSTAKLTYPIADLFLVQWESLLKKYPKAKYWGKVI